MKSFNPNKIWKDKVELDGMVVKEEEEAIKKVKGEALKEKDNPRAFIFPIRLEGREEMKKVDRGITMINQTQEKVMRILTNVLCQVGVTTLIATFLILDIPIDRDAPIVIRQGFLSLIEGIVNTSERLFSTFDGFCHQTFRVARSDVLRTAESDSDDKEEYKIKRNKFGAPIYGPKPALYLDRTNSEDQSSAIQTTTGTHDDEAGSSRSKCPRQHETVEEVLLPQVHHEFLLWDGCSREAKSRYNTRLSQLLPKHIYSPCVVNWDVLNRMGCDGEIDNMLRIKVRKAESNEEIFTYVAWIRALNINKPIYAELCHEFYSTYEFDEVYADDDLQTKKIIKFRLGGRAHSLTLLEFGRRLGLYHAVELDEEGFNVYFEGGLRSDEHFNAQEYWLSISREENLGLFRSHTSTIKYPVLRVIHKMITYGLCHKTIGYDKIQKNDLWLLSMFDARNQNGYANVAWLIARWMKRKGGGTKKESQICCGQFISRIARKTRVLTDDVIRSLSAPIYCRDLNTTTLRELIDSEGRLIPEDPQPGVPREAVERMEYIQSYHWDRYQGVFEHMDGVYSVPLHGAYNPHGYAQPHISAQKDYVIVRDITKVEIKAFMFSIGDDKAPGSDGFTYAFLRNLRMWWGRIFVCWFETSSLMRKALDVESGNVIWDAIEEFNHSFGLVPSIPKNVSSLLDHPCHTFPSCDLVSLDQHAHTLCHLESRLTISLDNLCLDDLDIFKEDVEYQSSRRSHKSPNAMLFDVDTGRISIRHCEMIKSTTLNVLARSDDNA
ncbi:hypothetical protein Tco_0968007 [Tanacetum coccineum]